MTTTPHRTAVSIATLALLAACGGGSTDGGSVSGTERLSKQAVGPQARLTVKATGGTGRVFTTFGGVDCGTVCSADFDQGTVVSVRAVPAAGFMFDRWVEDNVNGCNDSVACNVTMSGAKTITAKFEIGRAHV